MIYPKKLENLIEHYKKLPTIGEKSAERLALATLEMPTEEVENFSKSLIGRYLCLRLQEALQKHFWGYVCMCTHIW